MGFKACRGFHQEGAGPQSRGVASSLVGLTSCERSGPQGNGAAPGRKGTKAGWEWAWSRKWTVWRKEVGPCRAGCGLEVEG